VLSLSEVVVQCLEKHHIGIIPDASRRRDVQATSSKVLRSIHTMVRARTSASIERTCSTFLVLMAWTSAVLQREYRQFVYSFFGNLAVQLFSMRDDDAVPWLIAMYRGIQPQHCQALIDRLLVERAEYVAPHFDVQIMQFALDDTMRNIENRKQALPSVIITTQINRRDAPFGHDLLFVYVGDATGADPGTPILSPVEAARACFRCCSIPGIRSGRRASLRATTNPF